MTTYYEKQTKQFLGNLLVQYPDYVSNSNAIDLWYMLLSMEEKREMCREISKFLKHAFDSEEKLFHIAPKKRTDMKDASENIVRYIESQDSTSDIFGSFDCLSNQQKHRIAKLMKSTLLLSSQEYCKEAHGDDPISEVKKIFQLTELETLIVDLFYSTEIYRDFQILLEDNRNNTKNFRVPARSSKFISKILNASMLEVEVSFRKNSTLKKYGLLYGRNDLNLSSDIIEFLSGSKDIGLMEKYSNQIDTSSSLPLESFQVSLDQLEIVKNILQSESSCSILFYGKPGAGKTELTKTLAKEANCLLFTSNILDEEGEDDNNHRKRSLFSIQNHPIFKNNIVVIDECDNLINAKPNFFFRSGSGASDEKGWVNEYLDQNKCKLIWITNTLANVDESTLRRFNYILEFESFTNSQRENAIKSVVKEDSFLSEENIKTLSKLEKLTTGHFSIAYKTVERMNLPNEKKEVYFNSILNQHLKSLGSPALRFKGITTNYSIEGLNVDQSPTLLIEQSKKILEKIEYEDADLNLNVLLYGPPGTGKTEYVKYLAQELDREIVLKRVSDLLSMYVGEAEKNIRRAFEMAEKEKKILFIDEADSLVSSREGHHRNWETTQVNEILTCMENFRGILVCATNHKDNLDMAAQRRFLFKLKFDYLNAEGVLIFYKKFFQNYVAEDLTDDQRKVLKEIRGLTPSDFNNLKRKFEIVPPVSHSDILNQLELEVGFKKELFKRKVGIN